jgi:hypothetical protein
MRHPLLNAFVFNHARPQQASNGKQASERRLVGSRNDVSRCSLDLIDGNHEREL